MPINYSQLLGQGAAIGGNAYNAAERNKIQQQYVDQARIRLNAELHSRGYDPYGNVIPGGQQDYQDRSAQATTAAFQGGLDKIEEAKRQRQEQEANVNNAMIAQRQKLIEEMLVQKQREEDAKNVENALLEAKKTGDITGASQAEAASKTGPPLGGVLTRTANVNTNDPQDMAQVEKVINRYDEAQMSGKSGGGLLTESKKQPEQQPLDDPQITEDATGQEIPQGNVSEKREGRRQEYVKLLKDNGQVDPKKLTQPLLDVIKHMNIYTDQNNNRSVVMTKQLLGFIDQNKGHETPVSRAVREANEEMNFALDHYYKSRFKTPPSDKLAQTKVQERTKQFKAVTEYLAKTAESEGKTKEAMINKFGGILEKVATGELDLKGKTAEGILDILKQQETGESAEEVGRISAKEAVDVANIKKSETLGKEKLITDRIGVQTGADVYKAKEEAKIAASSKVDDFILKEKSADKARGHESTEKALDRSKDILIETIKANAKEGDRLVNFLTKKYGKDFQNNVGYLGDIIRGVAKDSLYNKDGKLKRLNSDQMRDLIDKTAGVRDMYIKASGKSKEAGAVLKEVKEGISLFGKITEGIDPERGDAAADDIQQKQLALVDHLYTVLGSSEASRNRALHLQRKMAYNFQTANLMHKLYAGNLTEPEIKRAETFIPKFDTWMTNGIEMLEYLDNQITAIIDAEGKVGFGDVTDVIFVKENQQLLKMRSNIRKSLDILGKRVKK